MYRALSFVLTIVAAVLIVGCAPPAVGSPAIPTTPPSGSENPALTPGTVTSPAATPTLELAGTPGVATQAAAWLASEVKVAATDLRFVRAEQVEWTDSCFGLGGPAESCLQAMTPGWRLVFEAGGRQYEVRTDQAGSNFRLVPQAS